MAFHLSGARKILEPRVSSRMRMRVMFRSSSRTQLLYRGPSSDFQPAPLTTITCLSLVLYVVYTHNISFPFFLQEWPPYLGIRRRKKNRFPSSPVKCESSFFLLFVPTGFGWIDTNLGWLIRYALFFAGMSSAAVVIYQSDNIVKVRRRRKLWYTRKCNGGRRYGLKVKWREIIYFSF